MTNPVFRMGADAVDPSEVMLWQSFIDRLRLLALRALGDRAAAEDVAQETILRAIRASEHNCEAIRDHGAFLYGIARNVIADIRRNEFRHSSLPRETAASLNSEDPLLRIITEDENRIIRNALRSLPENDRKLLALAFVHGLKSPEIAAHLGESRESVRKRKSRLIQRLKAAFAVMSS